MKSTQKQQQQGRRSGNSLKLFDYFPDSKQHLLLLLLLAPARSSACCRTKKQLLDVAVCVCVCVCVCLSLSLHVQMLRVFFAFPSFLHRVAHHHHSKWDNHCYQRQQKHSYQAWKRWRRRNFLLHQTNGYNKSNSFCFPEKLPKQNAIYMKKPKKKKRSSLWFFLFLWVVL